MGVQNGREVMSSIEADMTYSTRLPSKNKMRHKKESRAVIGHWGQILHADKDCFELTSAHRAPAMATLYTQRPILKIGQANLPSHLSQLDPGRREASQYIEFISFTDTIAKLALVAKRTWQLVGAA